MPINDILIFSGISKTLPTKSKLVTIFLCLINQEKGHTNLLFQVLGIVKGSSKVWKTSPKCDIYWYFYALTTGGVGFPGSSWASLIYCLEVGGWSQRDITTADVCFCSILIELLLNCIVVE